MGKHLINIFMPYDKLENVKSLNNEFYGIFIWREHKSASQKASQLWVDGASCSSLVHQKVMLLGSLLTTTLLAIFAFNSIYSQLKLAPYTNRF